MDPGHRTALAGEVAVELAAEIGKVIGKVGGFCTLSGSTIRSWYRPSTCVGQTAPVDGRVMDRAE